MPAIERSFADHPPSGLYLDTNITIDYLVANRPHHARCVDFLDRARDLALTTVYLSPLSWAEFTHANRKESFRSALPEELQVELRVRDWQDPRVRGVYIDFFLALFRRLIEHFPWAEIPLTSSIRTAAIELIKRYNLGTQDALHVASAFGAGVHDFASFDEGYRRVDDLILWNDLIYVKS
jgi:predicted nucleic acid-binding protein